MMVSGDHDGGDDYDGDVTKTRNKIVMLVISFFFLHTTMNDYSVHV